MDDLRAAEFRSVAKWRRGVDSISCDGDVPQKSGLYLFVVEQHVRYVGSALNRLDKRMQSYQRRQRDQRSNRPVQKELADAVNRGECVEVYVRAILEGVMYFW